MHHHAWWKRCSIPIGWVLMLLFVHIEGFDYAIVLDCGSKGTRLYVYRRDYTHEKGIVQLGNGRPLKKVVPGLASFAPNPKSAVQYLLPLLQLAAEVIPQEAHFAFEHPAPGSREDLHGIKHPSTEVFVLGTGGLRLITLAQEDALFDAVVEGLNARQPFTLRRHQVVTLSGSAEAFYAALSVNFLLGSIDADLKRTGTHALVGALDLGGASTQIVFPTSKAARAGAEGAGAETTEVTTDDFWAASYLHYGSEMVKERIFAYLAAHHAMDPQEAALATQAAAAVAAAIAAQKVTSNGSGGSGNGDAVVTAAAMSTTAKILVHNPCDMLDHREEWVDMGLSAFALGGGGLNGGGGGGDGKARSENRGSAQQSAGGGTSSSSSSGGGGGGGGGGQAVGSSTTITRYEFHGTGDAASCSHVIRRVLWGDKGMVAFSEPSGGGSSGGGGGGSGAGSSEATAEDQKSESGGGRRSNALVRGRCVGDEPCPMEGVAMPKVPRGTPLVCMSSLYSSIDALHDLVPGGLPHWPTPSLVEVQKAATTLCAEKWSPEKWQGYFDERDPGHYPEALLHRVCLHAVYGFTLLRDAYGLDLEARELTFAHSLEGHELSWVLGAAMSQFASFAKHDKKRVAERQAEEERTNAVGGAGVGLRGERRALDFYQQQQQKQQQISNDSGEQQHQQRRGHSSDLALYGFRRPPPGTGSLVSTLDADGPAAALAGTFATYRGGSHLGGSGSNGGLGGLGIGAVLSSVVLAIASVFGLTDPATLTENTIAICGLFVLCLCCVFRSRRSGRGGQDSGGKIIGRGSSMSSNGRGSSMSSPLFVRLGLTSSRLRRSLSTSGVNLDKKRSGSDDQLLDRTL